MFNKTSALRPLGGGNFGFPGELPGYKMEIQAHARGSLQPSLLGQKEQWEPSPQASPLGLLQAGMSPFPAVHGRTPAINPGIPRVN